MMSYIVLKAPSHLEIQELVNDKMKLGYGLYGMLTVVPVSNSYKSIDSIHIVEFYQPMVYVAQPRAVQFAPTA